MKAFARFSGDAPLGTSSEHGSIQTPFATRAHPATGPERLADESEMGELIRAKDWSETPIGATETWSPTLRVMVSFLLANRFPLLLWWGPHYTSIYNDAYRPILGKKHPTALGQPVSVCWSEIWPILKPLIDTPFLGGPPTWIEDLELEINRSGYTEETHFTIAYSPVPDETAPRGIGGVLATVHEITAKIVGERRVIALRDLGARAALAKTSKEACLIAAESLGKHTKDIPFALLYLLDADGSRARLAGASGVTPGSLLSPRAIDLPPVKKNRGAWPLGQAMQTNGLYLVEDLSARFGDAFPQGPWSEVPRQAAIVPIRSNVGHQFAGLLVAGVSARLRFDDLYGGFLELVASQIAVSIANARLLDEERSRADALAEIDRAKTAFFSNVSHEFRTPLTLMMGPLEESLADPIGMSVEHRGHVEVAHRNSLRLLKLVNTLLDFSRLEAGRSEAIYEPTDLSRLTTDLASTFRSAIEKAGLRFIVDCPQLDEDVFVDRSMWEKIVFNLLSNAFKFTFEGTIEVQLRCEGGNVVLRVRDTGTGIPRAEQEHIFERFHRVKGARGRSLEGSGIGLALVQELVRLHSGTVQVQSEADRGSTFRVAVPLGITHLPRERLGAPRRLASTALGSEAYIEEALRWLPEVQPEAATSPGHSEGNTAGRDCHPEENDQQPSRARILLVDDNADMRDYIKRLLGKRYEAVAVSNGSMAAEVIRTQPFELVLADVMMPGLDGFQFLRMLRNDPTKNTIPVILISARAGQESRIEGLEHGADDYLIKPFSARELLARVDAHLRLAGLRQKATQDLRSSEERFRKLSERLGIEVRSRTEELEQRNTQVAKQAEQLRKLSARLLQLQDEERRRIARELHDSIGQLLTALGMNLVTLAKGVRDSDPRLAHTAEDSEQLIRQLTGEIRTMSYLLHPPLLDESGLAAALNWYIQGLRERGALEVRLSLPLDLGRLPRDMELVIFRLVQECLTNVHRHSGSKAATVLLARNPEGVILEVADRGRGISVAKLAEVRMGRAGVGLGGMRERVHQLGGELNIDSNPFGTKILIRLPESKHTHFRRDMNQSLPGAD